MNVCSNCGNPLAPTDLFCGGCGAKRSNSDTKNEQDSVRNVIIFYITFLVFAIVSYVVYLESDSLITEIIFEAIFILITVGFSLLDIKGILPLYGIKKINWRVLLFSIGFPVLTAFVVYYGVGWLNIALFDEDYNMFYDYEGYENGFFWAFLFVVIVAPVFEELAFRGFLFNQLRNVTSANVTILATALIFALVHFSFISVLWIFPFGIVLGYLRHRYNTLWLGMIMHFIHNFLVLMLEYYYYLDDPYAELFVL